MKSIRHFKKWQYLCALTLCMFASCESEFDKYYETPSWLKGNAWQVLEQRGNYTTFLRGVELIGFRDAVEGKGILTVAAPDNEAFGLYLSQKGYTSIEDMPINELRKVIAYHLIYYSYSKDRFMSYNPNGIDAELGDKRGLYFKFRTKSRDEIESMVDITTADGKVRKVFHKELFLPVIASTKFNTLGLDAKSNYEYFFPTSVWGGDGFNMGNASVKEYEIVTDNGYVYLLNEVIEPLETIYKELKSRNEYTDFLTIYDKFSDFVYSETLSQEYGNGDSLFLQYHSPLPRIASEWSDNPNVSLPDFAQLADLALKAENVFVPSNEAMNKFFDEFWGGEAKYTSLNQVNFIPLLYFLKNHVYSGSLLYPDQVSQGTYRTELGTNIEFQRSEVQDKSICANGAFYGLNTVQIPAMFKSVTAPAFMYPEYNMFLMMLDRTNRIQPLMSDLQQFRLYLPDDNILEEYTEVNLKRLRYINTNNYKYGAQTIEIESDGSSPWTTMSVSSMNGLVGSHIAEAKPISERGDEKIYKTLSTWNYLYEKGDKVFSSASYNSWAGTAEEDDKVQKITSLGKMANGETFKLSQLSSALLPEYKLFKDVIQGSVTAGVCPQDFYYFQVLLSSSQIFTTTPSFNFLQGDRFITLIPSQDAILAGLSSIPMSPSSKLTNYLKYYYVKVNDSGFSDYPFTGTIGQEKEVICYRVKENGEFAKLVFIDGSEGMKIRDERGNEVNVISYFPRIYSDGAAYMIDGLLDLNE